MARPDEPSPPRRFRWLVVALLAVLALGQVSGCSCRSQTPAERAARIAKEEAERKAEEERKREEERRRQPIVLPPGQLLPSGDQAASLFVKPGHWNTVVQPAKANAEDFDGLITYEVVSREGDPITAPGTPLRLVSRRPLVVARESTKTVDSLFYCPPSGAVSPWLRSNVRARRTGYEAPTSPDPLRPLAGHQYHFVVLAKEPGRYAFVDSLYSVTSPLEGRTLPDETLTSANRLAIEKNYRVVAVPTDAAPGEALLPDNPLAWTSIAYLLWDEVDPELLRPSQRDALVDWINWGGQLIVNGPDSLDLLRGSFLEPLLPATAGSAREIDRAELNAMENQWSVGGKGKPLEKTGPWSGVELRRTDDATSLPGLAGLCVERRVGRGRILVTAMQLSDRRLLGWTAGYDNFFNAAILRRPPRKFVRRNDYADEKDKYEVAVVWADGEPLRIDPTLNTKWRGFVRDVGVRPDDLTLRVSDEGVQQGFPGGMGGGFGGGPNAGFGGAFGQAAPQAALTSFKTLKPARIPGGVGAVRDFGPVASAVRSRLRESAGVSVPDAGFVIGCLAAYLLVLVPANWGICYAMKRVEYAWAAAPLIAIGAGWVVIQQAQLDIGFVRSRTEIAVLELQPDTPRGLLTRFTALYTSLSTTYELEFESPAVAAPFPRTTPEQADSLGPPATVAYERLEKSRLRDVAVSSASTEFVRSEEMFDLTAAGVEGSSVPGSLRLAKGPSGAPRLENRTGWVLEDVMVVGRPDGLKGEPRLEGCWLGDLTPGGVANVAFLPIAPTGEELPFATERASAARIRDGEEAAKLDLDALLRMAVDPANYEPGERRVVARVSRVLPGLAIAPESSQRKGATLIVGALGYGVLPTPGSDANGPLDVN